MDKGKKGRTLEERFYAFCDISNGCWVWTGAKDKDGYGLIRVAGKNLRAHRLSAEMHKQSPVPKGVHVCHSCDNPSCVNPDHLWFGDNSKNQVDCVRKGRRRNQKMLLEDVVYAKRAYFNGELTQAALCAEFGVSAGYMSSIMTGRKWSHVD